MSSGLRLLGELSEDETGQAENGFSGLHKIYTKDDPQKRATRSKSLRLHAGVAQLFLEFLDL